VLVSSVSCSVLSACCKCFGSSKWMLQVFIPDVAGDYVSIVVRACCGSSKCLFQVCHVVFRLCVASVSVVRSGCCRCFNKMLHVFQQEVSSISVVESGCFMCCTMHFVACKHI
jgi:hypothetical protein